jgi:hypothetical protein
VIADRRDQRRRGIARLGLGNVGEARALRFGREIEP